MLTFHDLRGTGITWMAVRGDEPLRIQQSAGRAHFATTQGYIRAAEDHQAGFGHPFPTLPDSLNRTQQTHADFLSCGDDSTNWRPRRDSNPCYSLERAVSWAWLDDGDFVEARSILTTVDIGNVLF